MREGPAWSVAVVVGVAWGVLSSTPAGTFLALAVAAVSLAVMCDASRWRRRALAGALCALAAAHGAQARTRALAPPLVDWFLQATAGVADARELPPVTVRGRLAQDASLGPTGVSLSIAVAAVRPIGGAWRAAAGRVGATVGGAPSSAFVDAARAGRLIEAPVFLRIPQELRNPGGPDPTRAALRRTADLVGTIKSRSLVTLGPSGPLDAAAAAVRAHVRRAIAASVGPLSAQSAAVVTAILIGDRTGLDDGLVRRLQVAGTYHVLAISGAHIAILTALCLFVFRLVLRSARATALLTLVVIVAYGDVVGAHPSIERAVTAAVVYLLLSVIGLRPPALTMLCVVAAVVVVLDPRAAVDAGAWLSFGATLGIVVGATRVARWATTGAPPTHWARRVWHVALGMLATTVSAELALVPVSAAVFARVSAAGLLLNFVAIPAMTMAQLAGLVVVALHGWWPAGEALAAHVAHWGATGLAESARLVEMVPMLAWRTPPTWIGWTVAYYAGWVGVLAWRGWRWPRRIAVGAVVVAGWVIVAAPGLEWRQPRAGWLRLTMVDVGQGDSILVQFPTHQSLLVDAGGVPGTFDVGDRVVAPALWAEGVRRLDWLLVTHADHDHIGGASGVVTDLAPREVWAGIPVPNNAALDALGAEVQARGAVWRQVLEGQTLEVGSVRIDALNPPAPDWERRKVRNDDSVVLRVRFSDVEIFLTGDMEQEVEARWPNAPDPVPLRIVKVPHHGSRTSSSWPWVRTIAPQLALVSVGRDNLFGHPAPEVLDRYRQVDASVFRTDQDGAVVVETNGAVVRVRTISGRTMTVVEER